MTLTRSLLIAALATTALSAQTRIWVDPVTGSNGNPGTAAQPVQTLSTAIGLAASNDEIMLLPGIYSTTTNGEVFPIVFGSIATQNNLVVRGVNGAVFDLGGATTTALRFTSGATGMRMTNVTFMNSDQLGWWTRLADAGAGVNSGNCANNVEIDRCQFINLNRVFVFWDQDTVSGWKVHDCLFQNLTNDAILEYVNHVNNQFYNNTFYGNLYKAYISDSVNSLCYNNLVVNNAIAFECNNAATNPARWQNNWVYNCPVVMQGSGMTTASLPPTNIIGLDPLMVNPTGGDFHLQATSPCIDIGDTSIFARMDLDGVSRMVDSNGDGSIVPEIGCYEVSPLSMTARFDPTIGVLILSANTTVPGMVGFTLFSLDDGLITIPGISPILVSPTRYLGYLLSIGAANWYVNLNPVLPLLPGTRVVNHLIGFGAGPTILGGNQTWTQF